ncbi:MULTISPECIES: DUF4405 domain-containing protein [Thermodesulfovibrio]|uniref:DUF4405 domain-containing protein n=1 Tax=Thermodesulfovibrio TaxID=28261 RepID=UPI00261CA1C3|nr:DUF4405 domain-containing protein [Thermodesulfovibrio sp.]
MAKFINTRGFVSLLTAFSFLFAFVSGVVLYFTPQGRIAYWINWKFLGLTKTDWTNMHIIFCIVFMITAFFHIYYNWNVLLNYIYSKVKKAMNLKKELAIVFIFVILSLISSIKPFPPFSLLIEFSDYLKNAWIKSPDYEPPYGHAELLSLEEFSKRRNIDLNKALEILRTKNIKISSTKESLGVIAKNNGISPKEVYEVLKSLEGTLSTDISKSTPIKESSKGAEKSKDTKWTKEEIITEFEGKGLGRKTLKQISEENGVIVQKALTKLKSKGLYANEKDTLRQIAEKNNTSPIEVLIIVLEDEEKKR